MSTPKLTEQQKLFVLEFLKDFNATQACLRAGYCKSNPKNADKTGPNLLTKPQVQDEIRRLTKDRTERLSIEADDILRRLYNIADVDIADIFDDTGALKPIHEIPIHTRKCISSIDIDELKDRDGNPYGFSKKIKFDSRIGALRDLGRYLKLFVDRVEHSGTVGLADKLKKARERVKNEN